MCMLYITGHAGPHHCIGMSDLAFVCTTSAVGRHCVKGWLHWTGWVDLSFPPFAGSAGGILLHDRLLANHHWCVCWHKWTMTHKLCAPDSLAARCLAAQIAWQSTPRSHVRPLLAGHVVFSCHASNVGLGAPVVGGEVGRLTQRSLVIRHIFGVQMP